MLDRLADEAFGATDAGAILHEDLSQELVSDNGTATLRLPIPFVEKADIGLETTPMRRRSSCSPARAVRPEPQPLPPYTNVSRVDAGGASSARRTEHRFRAAAREHGGFGCTRSS